MIFNLIMVFFCIFTFRTTASNLISQGYYVIEDSKLDFHSSEQIKPDVSRIGEITGSSIAKQNTIPLEKILLLQL